jgi:hypothetical protein
MNAAVMQYMAKIGRKGGKATSEAKTIACRENAKRPRKRKKVVVTP